VSALVNPTFWLVAGLMISALRPAHSVQGATSGFVRGAVAWPVLLALVVIAAMNVGIRGLIGHAVPGDFVQEVVAARSMASEGSLYSADINGDVQHWLQAEPPPLASWWPDPLTTFLQERQRQGRNRLVAQAHPPTLLLLFMPFVQTVGAYATYWILVALSVIAAICASQWMVSAWLPGATRQQRMLAAVAAVAWQPTLASIRDGQVSVLVGALAIGTWHALRSEKPGLSGLSAGLATALKLYPAPLLGLLVFRRSRAALYGTAVLLGAVTLVCAIAGWSAWADFASSARSIGGAFSPAPHNLALTARLAALMPPPWLPIGYGVAAFAMCIATAVAVGHRGWHPARPQVLDLDFAVVLTLSLLLSPVAWHHYLFMLTQPLALALVLALQSGRRGWMVAWALAVLVMSLPDDAIRAAWVWLPSSDVAIGLASPGLVIAALWTTFLVIRLSARAQARHTEPSGPTQVALSS
jgi:hypothetical protein